MYVSGSTTPPPKMKNEKKRHIPSHVKNNQKTNKKQKQNKKANHKINPIVQSHPEMQPKNICLSQTRQYSSLSDCLIITTTTTAPLQFSEAYKLPTH